MRISALERTVDGDLTRLAARVQTGSGEVHDLWFEFQGVPPEWVCVDRYDAFMAAVFPLAFRKQEPLESSGAVSAPLCSALRGAIADVWLSWFPGTCRIDIRAAEAEAPARGQAVGLFFSGGVDSFYAYLTMPPVTHWLTAVGFDVRLADGERAERLLARHRRLAAEFGVKFVSVRTNLRSFSDAVLDWELYHGAALAALGLALSGWFRRFHIASSTGSQSRWGSHAGLDPLWSNDAVEFVHDRVGVPRIDKIRRVATDPRALASLRVCWEYRTSAENCSVCEKCLRTMTALDQLGLRDRALTFDWSGYPFSLLALAAPVRTLHHWRTLALGYPLSPHGALMKLLLLWVEIHSRVRGLFRPAKARYA